MWNSPATEPVSSLCIIPLATPTEKCTLVETLPVASLVNPSTVFATVNTWVASPIVPVPNDSLCPSGRELAWPYCALSVEATFPVTLEIKTVAVLLNVLDANIIVP